MAKSYNWLRRNLAYTYLGKPKAWNVLARMNRVMKKIMTYNQTVVPRAAMPATRNGFLRERRGR